MRKPKVVTAEAVRARPVTSLDRAAVIGAFRAGLRIDGASDAAGAAFLAVSWTNRGDINRARAFAVEARRRNPLAWQGLLDAIGTGDRSPVEGTVL